MFDLLSAYLQKVLGMGYRSSAVSPLLWLNALVSIPCLMGSFAIQSAFRWAPFSIAVLVIGYTLYKYNTLVDRNPRLVQSEKFQLESQKLDLVAQKGGPIVVNPVHLPLTEEPKYIEAPIPEEEREGSL
jgi:hypothetical protein